MNKLLKILVYLKQPEDRKSSLYPIYIRITIDGNRAEISTKRYCEPSKWNKVAGKMIGYTEKVRQLNAFLDGQVSKIYESQNEPDPKWFPGNSGGFKKQSNG